MVTRVGNDDPNTINGTSDNDFLSGKGGSDNLYGFAGDDIFDPGTNPVLDLSAPTTLTAETATIGSIFTRIAPTARSNEWD